MALNQLSRVLRWLLALVDPAEPRLVEGDADPPAPPSGDSGPLLVSRAQSELESEESRATDLLTKVGILTALATIEVTGGVSIVGTELHSRLPLQHHHVSLPALGRVGLGSVILAVLIVLYAGVLVGAGAGLIGLIARRFTGKRSSQARLERVESYASQLRDPSDRVCARQMLEMQVLIAAHVTANDRRDRLLRWLVTPAVIVGILATGGLAAVLGAGPVRPTQVTVQPSGHSGHG